MRFLLDTHAFLWFITDDSRLGEGAKQAINLGANRVFLSIASLWEIAIKVRIGKLDLGSPFDAVIPQAIAENAFEPLPLSLSHIAATIALPLHHRDPFDRMLVAQAIVEGVPILSVDQTLDAYGVTRVW